MKLLDVFCFVWFFALFRMIYRFISYLHYRKQYKTALDIGLNEDESNVIKKQRKKSLLFSLFQLAVIVISVILFFIMFTGELKEVLFISF